MSIERRTRKRDGRPVYDVRLRDPNGREYSRTFSTLRDAKDFLARERADRARGSWIDPRRAETKFAEVAEWWLRSNPSKRSGSIARDESILRVHLLPVLGPRPLGTMTPRDVQQIVTTWAEGRAARTVRRQYGTLRAVLNAAVELDLIARSPCRGIKLPAVSPLDRPMISSEELAALAAEVGPDVAPMVYLGAVLGLRWGECAGLRVGRLDFMRGTLTVAEQATRGRRGEATVGPPKSRAADGR